MLRGLMHDGVRVGYMVVYKRGWRRELQRELQLKLEVRKMSSTPYRPYRPYREAALQYNYEVQNLTPPRPP